nr:hypothetical protein [uncultured Butyricicoccus sp.]
MKLNFSRGQQSEFPTQSQRKWASFPTSVKLILKLWGIFAIVISCMNAVQSPLGGFIGVALGAAVLHQLACAKEAVSGIRPKKLFKRRWMIITSAAYILCVIISFAPKSITKISSYSFVPSTVQLPNSQTIMFDYMPVDAKTDNVTCSSSNESVAIIAVDSVENGKIKCTLTPISTGSVSIQCTAGDISANPINIEISDPAVLEAQQKAQEEAARKEAEAKAAEEAAKAEAEQKEAEAKAAEEAARQAEKEAAEQKAQEILKEASGEESAPQSSGQTVYITPSGKRYHLDPDCGGKNAHAVDISKVGSRTPCQKCAGG